MKRFIRAHSLVYRMGTHVSQRKPEEVAVESSDYMDLMHQIVEGPRQDRHFIINMDQTPVYFTMNAKRTLEVIGVKTVHIRTSTNDKSMRRWLLLSRAQVQFSRQWISLRGRLVVILAGALFYGTVTFQKKLVSIFFVPLSTNYLSYQSSIH